MSTQRHGNRWTINEILSLQREYELLEWDVFRIASKHQRTVSSILFKLEAESFISNWSEARGFDFNHFILTGEYTPLSEDVEEEQLLDADCNNCSGKCVGKCSGKCGCSSKKTSAFVDTEEEDNQVDTIYDRVWSLETSVSQISAMVKQMFDTMVSDSASKSLPDKVEPSKPRTRSSYKM